MKRKKSFDHRRIDVSERSLCSIRLINHFSRARDINLEVYDIDDISEVSRHSSSAPKVQVSLESLRESYKE